MLYWFLFTSAQAIEAGDFQCIDKTSFRHYTSPTEFAVKKCPDNMCVTRNPPNQDPCIGEALARQIDGTIGTTVSNSSIRNNVVEIFSLDAPVASSSATIVDSSTDIIEPTETGILTAAAETQSVQVITLTSSEPIATTQAATSTLLSNQALNTPSPLNHSVAAIAAAAVENNFRLSPIDTGFQAGDYLCIDTNQFRHYTSPTTFALKICPGVDMCYTRNPRNQNPCIGRAAAIAADTAQSILNPIQNNLPQSARVVEVNVPVETVVTIVPTTSTTSPTSSSTLMTTTETEETSPFNLAQRLPNVVEMGNTNVSIVFVTSTVIVEPSTVPQ